MKDVSVYISCILSRPPDTHASSTVSVCLPLNSCSSATVTYEYSSSCKTVRMIVKPGSGGRRLPVAYHRALRSHIPT